MKNNKHLWNKIWSKSKTSSSELRKSIQNELRSIRWKKIEKQVLNKWKSFKGLTERATFLDNYLGYALILIGYNV